MEHKKYIIAFVGHACTGKSVAARTLAERASDIYLVSTDKQKWLLSGYDRNTHPVPIKEITFGLLKAVCKTGLPIQLEYIRTKEDYFACRRVAKKFGYELFVFEFLAPLPILLERFHARVADAKATGKKISITTEEVFLQNIEKGYFAPSNAMRFDTTQVSTEEIVQKVLERLGPDFTHIESKS